MSTEVQANVGKVVMEYEHRIFGLRIIYKVSQRGECGTLDIKVCNETMNQVMINHQIRTWKDTEERKALKEFADGCYSMDEDKYGNKGDVIRCIKKEVYEGSGIMHKFLVFTTQEVEDDDGHDIGVSTTFKIPCPPNFSEIIYKLVE